MSLYSKLVDRMNIRELRKDDAIKMLQWMHDRNVVQYMNKDFMSMTLEDCICFIENARNNHQSKHFAVIDDQNQYIGTVSLKNIQDGYAEFAIAICSEAMGKGYGRKAMEDVIAVGFQKIGIHIIYWNVSKENKRAIRFYDHQYTRHMDIPDFLQTRESFDTMHDLYWYYVINENS